MIITDTTDYCTVLWMQHHPEWQWAVNSIKISGLREGISAEGFAGYIEVKVEINIFDLSKFAKIVAESREEKNRDDILSLRKTLLKC